LENAYIKANRTYYIRFAFKKIKCICCWIFNRGCDYIQAIDQSVFNDKTYNSIDTYNLYQHNR